MPLRVLSQMPTPCVYRLVLRTPYMYLHAAREFAYAEILRDILRWRLRFLIVQFGLIYPPGLLLVRDCVLWSLRTPYRTFNGLPRRTVFSGVQSPQDEGPSYSTMPAIERPGIFRSTSGPGEDVIAIEDPGRNIHCSPTRFVILQRRNQICRR